MDAITLNDEIRAVLDDRWTVVSEDPLIASYRAGDDPDFGTNIAVTDLPDDAADEPYLMSTALRLALDRPGGDVVSRQVVIDGFLGRMVTQESLVVATTEGRRNIVGSASGSGIAACGQIIEQLCSRLESGSDGP